MSENEILQSKNPGEALSEINRNICDALNEMFDRVKIDGDIVEIVDQKNWPPVDSGVHQDCEFGMILISGKKWLVSHNDVSGSISEADKVEEIITKVFKSTLNRILVGNKEEDVGGRADGQKVFFSGKPYTYFQEQKGEKIFSANLDAAMLIIGFLITAIEEYNEVLKKEPLNFNIGEDVKYDVKNFRDAGLFVCLEGLEYAQKCKIYSADREFIGFTCDPKTSALHFEKDSEPVDKYDRLFFSWTACETIRDLAAWTEFLEKIKSENPRLIQQLLNIIGRNQASIVEAGVWSYNSFLDDFKRKKNLNVKELVFKIENEELDAQNRDKELENLRKHLSYVYHYSQFLAIQSLSPTRISVDDMEKVLDNMDKLVKEDIIESKLDSSGNKKLSDTLTRFYSLGLSNKNKYPDDAYYPLVVRSISGLLQRMMSDYEKISDNHKILPLVRKFKKRVDYHVNEMLKRHPKVKEEGDEKLWSYFSGAEYVLYATQRTIFGLLTYGDFLEELEYFERKQLTGEGAKDRLRTALAESIADTLLGHEVMKKFDEFYSSSHGDKVLPLPEQQWASDVICRWLEKFSEDFKNSGIADFLKQKAQSIISIWKNKDTFLEAKKVDEDQKKTARDNLKTLKNSFNKILTISRIGTELNTIYESNDWDINKIIPLLFEYIFFEAMSKEKLPGDLRSNNATDLWGYIGIFKSHLTKM